MRDISIFIFAMQFCKNPYFESKRIIDPFWNAPLFFFFYIELTTCFHEFSEYKCTNFFHQILHNIIFYFFKYIRKTEKKQAFWTSNKKFIFFFNWEILVKKIIDYYSENSWKHVVSSIFKCNLITICIIKLTIL